MTITPDDVAEAMRDWVDANNVANTTLDYARLKSFERESIGYGYRTAAARQTARWTDEFWQQNFDPKSPPFLSYHLELETLRTSVSGDMGFAWGRYTEAFQEPGKPPERSRVRFTHAMARDESGWKVMLFHRDIQPFGEDGWYDRSLTAGT